MTSALLSLLNVTPRRPDEEARAKVVMFCSFLVDLQAELVFYHWRKETSTAAVHKHFRDIKLLKIFIKCQGI